MTSLSVWFIALVGVTSLTACSPGEGKNVVSVASVHSPVDLGACLAIARGETPGSGSLCPGFISAKLDATDALCTAAGGELVPLQESSLQALDVNGDGRSEFLFDVTENYQCDGAPSALSCGSLGCPVLLAEQRGAAWHTIGLLNAIDAVAAEVLSPESGSAYGILRGGCVGQRPCYELTYYRWDTGSYAASMIETNGHFVDVAPGGLWALLNDTPVLASPSAHAAVLATYPAGTDVVVIGDARDAPYKFVSPCNACESGFVQSDALHKPFERPAEQ